MSEVKVWRMEEGGIAVKTDGGVESAKAAYMEWITQDGDLFGTTAAEAAERVHYREGWYRWTPCSPRSCFDGGDHRPGHIQYEDGPGRGVWRGVMVDHH